MILTNHIDNLFGQRGVLPNYIFTISETHFKAPDQEISQRTPFDER